MSGAKPLFLLYAFMACNREKFTFVPFLKQFPTGYLSDKFLSEHTPLPLLSLRFIRIIFKKPHSTSKRNPCLQCIGQIFGAV